jgi:Fur family transcriptional regulator, zinc uptake regulator
VNLSAGVSEAAHDHQGCIERALKSADRLCGERGVRFTPLRRRVLELIWGSHEAVKAYDLLERLKPSDPTAKPSTVYRTLDFLLEQGLIHRVESLNAFIGCSHSGRSHDLLLLICEGCHAVEERPAPELMRAAAAEVKAAGFLARGKAFEVHGLCAQCLKTQRS